MNPGPYKSSTHGDILLSVRGRELLQQLRESTMRATHDHKRWTADISHARGELARYMSELEAQNNYALNLPKAGGISFVDVVTKLNELSSRSYSLARRVLREVGRAEKLGLVQCHRLPALFHAVQLELAAPPPPSPEQKCILTRAGEMRVAAHILNETEKTMTDQKTMTTEEPTRTQKIVKASCELDNATNALASLDAEITKNADAAPAFVHIEATEGFGYTRNHIKDLVKAQWSKLTAEALKAAKKRVRDAEKALAELVASAE